MSDAPDPDSIFSDDLASAEARMRRSLQLAGRPQAGQTHAVKQERFADRSPGARPRQRFVQDGEVPVTMVNRHRPQDMARPAADGALAAEQAARFKAERLLQEANSLIHDLQTKLGHAELARREAVSHDADLATALAAERQARLTAEAALEVAVAARALAETARATKDVPPAKPVRKIGPKAPVMRQRREPQPVKWWLAATKR